MRSPSKMRIIEIDITNACIHSCSNCTRFCGHQRKPFFMSFETFKRAVDSLDEFPNTVGMIGGEPTMHPEFERFIRYMYQKRVKKPVLLAREPIVNLNEYMKYFLKYGLKVWQESEIKALLLSSLNNSYYRHFELINEIFPRQLLNDHNNECLHQALLMSRKELGISDDEWIPKRDACWIQNTWSATITPKGAFFCEVAGALDMLFDGPGGWKIEPGWWKREPKNFGKQLEWCELCGGCLDVPKRLSNDERDDVTPGMMVRLKRIGSPKALAGKCVVHQPEDYEKFKEPTFTTSTDYMDAGGGVRSSVVNRAIYPKSVLLASPQNWREELKEKHPKDWVAIADQAEREWLDKLLSYSILNPGCFYFEPGKYVLFNVLATSIRDYVQWPQIMRNDIMTYYPLEKRIEITDTMKARMCRELQQLDFKSSTHVEFV